MHAARADAHASAPDPRERVTTQSAGPNGRTTGLGTQPTPSVTRDRVAAEGHAKAAAEHAAAAEELAQFDGLKCRHMPPRGRALCPLLGNLKSVEPIVGGARIRFVENGYFDILVMHILCHRQFADARGRASMERCPLYLPSVTVDVEGEAVILKTTPEQSGELVELLQHHLPGGGR